MNSHVAELVQLIQDAAAPIGGIGPTPVPARAVMPYVTVQKIAGKELESLDGLSNLVRTVMQVNCWSKSYEDADFIREFIKSAILDEAGISGSDIVINGPINHVLDAELYDPHRELHQCIVRFLIWWDRPDSISMEEDDVYTPLIDDIYTPLT